MHVGYTGETESVTGVQWTDIRFAEDEMACLEEGGTERWDTVVRRLDCRMGRTASCRVGNWEVGSQAVQVDDVADLTGELQQRRLELRVYRLGSYNGRHCGWVVVEGTEGRLRGCIEWKTPEESNGGQ